MKDVMIDLETLGTTPDAPIIAIGAVYFCRKTGALGDRFEATVDFNSACKGRRADPSTIKWWLGQSDAARKAVVRGDQGMECALKGLAAFIRPGSRPWGNGATFDISMLEHAFRQYKLECPWKFWDVRDCRTVEDLAPVSRRSIRREGTHHSALDDAIHQARYISVMVMSLCG